MSAPEWMTARTPKLVLVEGESDRIAVTVLARRMGWDLSALDVSVVSTGGASAFPQYLSDLATADLATPVSGLCDVGEVDDLLKGLESARPGSELSPEDLPGLGFFVCDQDLEDELIRATGEEAVVAVIADAGDGPSLTRLQRQPAWRGRPLSDQLRRFMSSQSGRKARYARLLVEQMELARAPAPLADLVAHVAGRTDSSVDS